LATCLWPLATWGNRNLPYLAGSACSWWWPPPRTGRTSRACCWTTRLARIPSPAHGDKHPHAAAAAPKHTARHALTHTHACVLAHAPQSSQPRLRVRVAILAGHIGGGLEGRGRGRKKGACSRTPPRRSCCCIAHRCCGIAHPALSFPHLFSTPLTLRFARHCRPSTERFLSEIVPRRHADVSQLFWRRTGQTRPWQAWIPLTRSRLRWRLPWWSSPGTGDGLRGALHDVPRGGGRLCEALMSVCSNAAPQCAFARR
jgi:hypothetical protein